MWICRRCKARTDDARKICRACGGILEEMPDDTPLPESEQVGQTHVVSARTPMETDRADRCEDPDVMAGDDAPSSEEPVTRPNWECPGCGEIVPGSFDVCWNCGSEKTGERTRGAAGTPTMDAEANHDVKSKDSSADARLLDQGKEAFRGACPQCGSTRIIWDVTVCDQGKGSDGESKVVVYGNPEALFFKDRLYGEIRADICGSCGHIQFHVANPSELYDHYRGSLGLD